MDLDANKVINCSVHKDFIYFRMFKFVLSLSEKKLKNTKTRMNEIGPQMTLRLYRFTEEVEGKKAVKHYKKYIKNRNLL
ncbi:hypothetical protein ECANGB1_1191 [Enterospora canceri]|uniref:Brix domain-containing protein n=1 Tax=Enterospora canceri TaxID=1081671 RepID=A0A1Y1S419_9MICR|nr:hypothetical protein ECANGB1_1191 [Enterospora canceri]